MKYVDEFRRPDLVKNLALKLKQVTTQKWTIMEVCGGQTHTIVKYGLHDLLPDNIRLIHGPGCPVCVTPIDLIDHALFIAKTPGTIICSFGDMVRVPGTGSDLIKEKALGANVHIIYSPLEAVELAQKNPAKQVVLFGVGFETTAPAHALAVYYAKELQIDNFSLLACHVLVPPAIEFLLQEKDCQVDGFLAAGHVCTITGYQEYGVIAQKYQRPVAVTGFEPLDILEGLLLCVEMLENKEYVVKNQYTRSAKAQGNIHAQTLLDRVFTRTDRAFRGIGLIEQSGLMLREEFCAFDATKRFPLKADVSYVEEGCLSGQVLKGKITPCQCPFFGKKCTPDTPLGAPMVSTEGACAAYYLYSQKR
jgi:hydrogenase expression/formation protein HypD